MGLELLLQGLFQLGLVLRLPLCTSTHWYVLSLHRDSSLWTDLRRVAEMKFDFQLGTPFTPFQQLMGVLPEDSKEHVPNAYRVCSRHKTLADDRT